MPEARTDEALERARSITADLGLLLLRTGAGSLMLLHGIPKLRGFSERAQTFPDPLGVGSEASLALAVFGEVVCSILMIVGLGARLFAVPYAFTMFVAGVVVHAADPWGKRELAFVYLLLGVAVALVGPGRISLDRWIAPRLLRRAGRKR